MATFNIKKRRAMEKMIYDTMDKLNPSGRNTAKYKALFGSMTDNQFKAWFEKFFADDDQNFYVESIQFKDEVNVSNIQDAADYLGVPLYEYILLPFENMDKENPVSTMFPVPVGYVHIRRVQQMVFKKSAMSTEIKNRDQRTGQVINSDKNGRSSDVENSSLLLIGAENTAREHLGPRADDMVMKTELYSHIKNFGYGELSPLTNSVFNKTTLNTTEVLFLGAGFKTNLITDTYELPRTVLAKKDPRAASDKFE